MHEKHPTPTDSNHHFAKMHINVSIKRFLNIIETNLEYASSCRPQTNHSRLSGKVFYKSCIEEERLYRRIQCKLGLGPRRLGCAVRGGAEGTAGCRACSSATPDQASSLHQDNRAILSHSAHQAPPPSRLTPL